MADLPDSTDSALCVCLASTHSLHSLCFTSPYFPFFFIFVCPSFHSLCEYAKRTDSWGIHSIVWKPVRGHLSFSLLPLSSPTLYLFTCITPHHLYTIFKDHTHSRWLSGPRVRRLPRSRLTNSGRLPASPPDRTSIASDGLRPHWDESMWCYGTLHHHMDNPIWEAWY
jgi:hypothetical protein